MIVVEKTTWEHKKHVNVNLSAIHIYWITAKNDKNFQNQEVINKESKILKCYCKANLSHAERGH